MVDLKGLTPQFGFKQYGASLKEEDKLKQGGNRNMSVVPKKDSPVMKPQTNPSVRIPQKQVQSYVPQTKNESKRFPGLEIEDEKKIEEKLDKLGFEGMERTAASDDIYSKVRNKRQEESFLEDRDNTRKKIISGKMSSGDKSKDNSTVKNSQIADMIRSYALEKGVYGFSLKTDNELIEKTLTQKPELTNVVNGFIEGEISAQETYNLMFKKNKESNASITPIGAIGLGGLGAFGGIKGLSEVIKRIPTEKKSQRVVNYIKANIIPQGNKVRPEFVDKKVNNVIDYFSNLSKKAISTIKNNKLGQNRGLYNQVVRDLKEVSKIRTALFAQNKGLTFGEEILGPLKLEIMKGGISSKFNDKLKGLEDVYDEIVLLMKENGGRFSLDDVEAIKETAYQNVDFTKSAKIASTAKEVKKGAGHKALGRGIKEAIEAVIPEAKIWNESYGKLKDMSLTIGAETVKTERMIPYSTIGKIQHDVGGLVGGIPGVSALSNVIEGDLPTKKIKESKLTKTIKTTKRFPNKIKNFVKKYGSVAEDSKITNRTKSNVPKAIKYVADSKIVKVGGKAIGIVVLLAGLNEVTNGAILGKVSADNNGKPGINSLTSKLEKEQAITNKGGTITPGKKTIVNPQAQHFKGDELGTPASYAMPIIGEGLMAADLTSLVANKSEEWIRKQINKFSKLSPEDKATVLNSTNKK